MYEYSYRSDEDDYEYESSSMPLASLARPPSRGDDLGDKIDVSGSGCHGRGGHVRGGSVGGGRGRGGAPAYTILTHDDLAAQQAALVAEVRMRSEGCRCVCVCGRQIGLSTHGIDLSTDQALSVRRIDQSTTPSLSTTQVMELLDIKQPLPAKLLLRRFQWSVVTVMEASQSCGCVLIAVSMSLCAYVYIGGGRDS